MENAQKRSYYFNVTEVNSENKIQEVMNFTFGGHHDLAAVAGKMKAFGIESDKHAKQLAVGLRLMHHVLKKYVDRNEAVKAFFPAFEQFKKAACGCGCNCNK